MLGAIIGDIVGSRWEFNPTNDYNFELFSDKNGYTDDTICTVAVADALLHGSDLLVEYEPEDAEYEREKGWQDENEPIVVNVDVEVKTKK